MSRKHLDAAIWPGGAFERFANNAEGIAALAALCTGHEVELVAM